MKVLVVEGGGMRGAYAGGALVGLQRAGERFDAVYASSSGACSAAYLAAEQPEGLRIWDEMLGGTKLINAANVLIGRPFLDLDYLIDEIFGKRVPLDVERLRASRAPLWVTLTDAESGAVEYRDLRRAEKPLRVLRATAALPIAYASPVELDGRFYLDGGVADPIPLAKAIADGATDVTVVLTQHAGFRHRSLGPYIARVGAMPYPGARDALVRHHERANAALDLIARPPAGVRIRVIAPPASLKGSRLSASERHLRAAVAQGLADAGPDLGPPAMRVASCVR
ncbi:MAG: patatin-like phospholipase family protein [Thermoplasmatota archaeon]